MRVLYRGPLSSCNYGCVYCPFAKHHESDAEHAHDAACLERFLGWARAWPGELSVFFTPWGEALVQPRYQAALAELTHLPHVKKAAIQTNLSAGLGFVEQCDASKLGVWATYHPEWTTRARFLSRVQVLLERGVSFSVGVVGFPKFADELDAIRAALPSHVYVWANAVKSLGYDATERARFERVDPLFPYNVAAHDSLGRACAGGHTVISVDGEGDVRTCHFIRDVIGNVYAPDFAEALKPRPCSAAKCGCHIGYVHLEHLGLQAVFGEGILERAARISHSYMFMPSRSRPGKRSPNALASSTR
ncbi:MAG: radical SAM protein [Myxococcaceae bacterium]|nr:radical SAM protein [Myxococcaceae bacterium]